MTTDQTTDQAVDVPTHEADDSAHTHHGVGRAVMWLDSLATLLEGTPTIAADVEAARDDMVSAFALSEADRAMAMAESHAWQARYHQAMGEMESMRSNRNAVARVAEALQGVEVPSDG
jgi:hypothetical protein